MASLLVVLCSIIAFSAAANNDQWDGISVESYDSADGESAASYYSLGEGIPTEQLLNWLNRTRTYHSFRLIARSIVQCEASDQLDLQQKSKFQAIVSDFMSQFEGWKLFSFMVHLDTKTQSIIHPKITFRAWMWLAASPLRFKIPKRFVRRAKSALLNFIPIFFARQWHNLP